MFVGVAVMFHVSRFPAADTFKTKLEICGFAVSNVADKDSMHAVDTQAIQFKLLENFAAIDACLNYRVGPLCL